MPPKAPTKTLPTLVIVESPSKAKTIEKYLGKQFLVCASMGHIIDLPKSSLGVDTEAFTPKYIVMRDKSKVMKSILSLAKGSKQILLASDPDREGEAIAWHLKQHLEQKLLSKRAQSIEIARIRFSEITKQAVLSAVKQPHHLNQSLIDAQQARRVIDRLFGYELSPLLWKKVKSRLSAGRVQSIALRIICEREAEVDAFQSVAYWEIDATVLTGKAKIVTHLHSIQGQKLASPNAKDAFFIQSESEALAISDTLSKQPLRLNSIQVKAMRRNPQAPFITSTLQQTANSLLGYPAAKTMRAAQALYEGIDLAKTRTGLITYMRTDSTRVSEVALQDVRAWIQERYGADYLPPQPNHYPNHKNAQDAHEAIRPTQVQLHPQDIKSYLTAEQFKLYELIWARFVASQMTPSQSENTQVRFVAGDTDQYALHASFSRLLFDGFQKVYTFGKKEPSKLPPKDLKSGDSFPVESVDVLAKASEPPPRYTDASLIKSMEELGIGRPSTYAPTIFTLTKRFYVKKETRSLVPTELGKTVNQLLVHNFPSLIDTGFTASMENELDAIEEQGKAWKEVVRHFYTSFHPQVDYAYEHMDTIRGTFDEKTPYVCEKCGAPMLKKLGRYGFFLACSRFPDCQNAQALPLGNCPKCLEGKVLAKKAKRGSQFYGCSRFPECDFSSYLKPGDAACPKDGSLLFIQKGQLCCLHEGCTYVQSL